MMCSIVLFALVSLAYFVLCSGTYRSLLHSPLKFTQNSVKNPALKYDLSSLPKDIQLHGTTTLSFKCKNGVIVAMDSRASMGSYVGSKTVRKVFPLSQFAVATIAGGAADCSYWIRKISHLAKLEKLYCDDNDVSIHMFAYMLAEEMRERRSLDISLGSMICGIDKSGPVIFYVDNEGSCVEGDVFSVGSGSSIANGILELGKDEGNGSLSNLEPYEAMNLAVKAIRYSTNRDCYSGGYINVLHINSTGIHHIYREDSKNLHIQTPKMG